MHEALYFVLAAAVLAPRPLVAQLPPEAGPGPNEQSARDQLGRTYTPHPGISERPIAPTRQSKPSSLPAALQDAVEASDARAAAAPPEPGISADWSLKDLELVHMLWDSHVAHPVLARFLQGQGAFDSVMADGVTSADAAVKAEYLPSSKTIQVAPDFFDEQGHIARVSAPELLGSLVAAVWHAYVDQIVKTGGDPETKRVLLHTASWLARKRLVEVKAPEQDRMAPIAPALKSEIEQLLGPGGRTKATEKAKPDTGRLATAYSIVLARQLMIAALAGKEAASKPKASIVVSEGPDRPAYRVPAAPPAELVGHLRAMLGLDKAVRP